MTEPTAGPRFQAMQRPAPAIDYEGLVAPWFQQCGTCDAGLTMSCVCPEGTVQYAMLELLAEVRRLSEALQQAQREKEPAQHWDAIVKFAVKRREWEAFYGGDLADASDPLMVEFLKDAFSRADAAGAELAELRAEIAATNVTGRFRGQDWLADHDQRTAKQRATSSGGGTP